MKKILWILIIGWSIGGMYSCQKTKSKEAPAIVMERNKEAREDSLKLQEALSARDSVRYAVTASSETAPVKSDKGEDAADDPAIWYNLSNPDESVVFGTQKKGGIYAYNLQGEELAFYPVGMINNIDLRQKAMIGDQTLDILAGSNRTDNSITLFSIGAKGELTSLMPHFVIDTAVIDEVYGFCMYKNESGKPFAIVNGKNGVIHQYEIVSAGQSYTLEKVAAWNTSSQPEGMVADDKTGLLFIAEEEKGIWKLNLKMPEAPLTILTGSQKENNPVIEYDIEGLAIYRSTTTSFLLASIQGSFSYAVFDLEAPHQYKGSFKVIDGIVDGAEETDGVEMYSGSIGKSYPSGLLVVQDGFNRKGEEEENQNFKLVNMHSILELPFLN